MTAPMFWSVFGLALLSFTAFGSAHKPVSAACAQANSELSQQIASNRLDDARNTVLRAVDEGGFTPVCQGLLLNNLAAGLQMSARFDEARTFAERAVACFSKSLPPEDPAYLPPLNVLATVSLEEGMTGRARDVLRRMQLVRAVDPSDRVLILSLSGTLLVREGRNQEAEAQYLSALSDVSRAEIEDAVAGSAIRGQLASLYIRLHRYEDARNMLNDALASPSVAKGDLPLVRIKLLNTRAVVSARQSHWADAETDLTEAVSLCRQNRRIDATELRSILGNYVYVLKKLHRKELRPVEAWLAAVRAKSTNSRNVIDVTELSVHGAR